MDILQHQVREYIKENKKFFFLIQSVELGNMTKENPPAHRIKHTCEKLGTVTIL